MHFSTILLADAQALPSYHKLGAPSSLFNISSPPMTVPITSISSSRSGFSAAVSRGSAESTAKSASFPMAMVPFSDSSLG